MTRLWVLVGAVLTGLVLYLVATLWPGPSTFVMEPSPYSLAAEIENSQSQIPEPIVLPEHLPPMLIGFSHQRVNDLYYELYPTHESAGILYGVTLCVGERANETTCNQRNADVVRETLVEGRKVAIVHPGRPLDDPVLRTYWETVPLTTERPDWLDLPAMVTDPSELRGKYDVLPETLDP
jgi:hypothetical protein